MEEWKDVIGYEGFYLVSNLGNVKRVSKNLKKTKQDGREIVNLCANGKPKRIHVHRLVAKSFIKNPENKGTVNHKNGIKTDNYVDNLEWMTRIENTKHGWENGLLKGRPKSV